MSDLVVDLSGLDPLPESVRALLPAAAERVSMEMLREAGPWSGLRHVRSASFNHCIVVVSEFRTPSRWLTMFLLALLARARECVLVDRHGQRRRPSWRSLVADEVPFALRRSRLARRVKREAFAGCRRLRRAGSTNPLVPSHVAFIRPDLGPALESGGSLAHIRGVVGGLTRLGCAVELLSPAPLTGVEDHLTRCHLVPEQERFRVSVELPHLAYNATLIRRGGEILADTRPDLIYQRHALGCYGGATLAQQTGLPLVVEYNGPEVWIGRTWGPLSRYGGLFEEIERRALLAADLVVAVSQPLVAHLRDAGVPDHRILVNPNGVDVDRFGHPGLDGERARVRERLGVDPGTLLAGFVGTFGPWHGAEILAEAIGRLEEDVLARTRFVFVGDGPQRAAVEQILTRAGRGHAARLTGNVAFDEIPSYLAAFDLCVSPHVGNADGSPFFGSPTKLFEYLASGKPIIASDLGQLGEVLEHGRTAWLVPPADADALAGAIGRLVRQPELRETLGRAGQDRARAHHSWQSHVGRILERLEHPVVPQ